MHLDTIAVQCDRVPADGHRHRHPCIDVVTAHIPRDIAAACSPFKLAILGISGGKLDAGKQQDTAPISELVKPHAEHNSDVSTRLCSRQLNAL
jgi:hypothetical protein